ncbi:CUB and sushi domain-containing protein 3-like, partial [Oncorhynchus tshawytscha]|uniref:CUB and sushi domain-containing protein 3-like n=1 Tax=Oncorhynchus tshawytscha TaxID=74940 RepID=UPI001C3D4969
MDGPPPLCQVQCPANEVRFDSTGVILSPGYPDSYHNLQTCSWLINVEKGYNVTLHFQLFQTEKEFDILEIFDGPNIYSQSLASLSGDITTPLTSRPLVISCFCAGRLTTAPTGRASTSDMW